MTVALMIARSRIVSFVLIQRCDIAQRLSLGLDDALGCDMPEQSPPLMRTR
jgi:hypothetical protein